MDQLKFGQVVLLRFPFTDGLTFLEKELVELKMGQIGSEQKEKVRLALTSLVK